MDNTLGVIIYDITGKILITKPTNGHTWSFPKGLPDEEEGFMSAAIREVLEETSLDLDKIKGSFGNEIHSQKYTNRDKKVHLFIFKSEEAIEGNYEIKCESFFELKGKHYPENDDAKWIFPEEAVKYLHEAQKSILLRLIENKIEKN
jgi:8-oxo-dGTP pyrophosphatase MutT (NUDIX family)